MRQILHMKTTKRLEELLDQKDAEIERLSDELEKAEDYRDRDWDWCRHREVKGKQTLPVPRMEIECVPHEPGSWHNYDWRYSLIYRHTCDHHVAVPMGSTTCRGGSNVSPIFRDKISTPFRDGVHIVNDAAQMNLPAFAICDGRTWKLWLKDGVIHQEEIKP